MRRNRLRQKSDAGIGILFIERTKRRKLGSGISNGCSKTKKEKKRKEEETKEKGILILGNWQLATPPHFFLPIPFSIKTNTREERK